LLPQAGSQLELELPQSGSPLELPPSGGLSFIRNPSSARSGLAAVPVASSSLSQEAHAKPPRSPSRDAAKKERGTKNQEQPPPAAYFNLPISPLNFMSIYPTQEYAVGYLVIKMKKTFTLIDEN